MLGFVLLRAKFELLDQLGVRRETFWVFGEMTEDSVQHFAADAGCNVRQNADWCRWLGGNDGLGLGGAGVVECALQFALEVGQCLLGVFNGDVAALNQRFYVQLANAAALGDCLVHQWLGVAGVVAFVVSVAAITNHVDDDVFMELLSVVEGKLGNAYACLWVVAVDVEDWCLHRFCNVA